MEKNFKKEIGGRTLTVKIKDLAEQSNGSVFLQYGDTLVLATAVMANNTRQGQGFFPLTVNYEEKFYAAGKIRGSRYVKREARPSDEATCNARLIDRSIRPLFPKHLNKEVQIVVTVLSWDDQNEPDIIGIMAASLALSISDIPWRGPVGALRLGRIADKFVINPTYDEMEESSVNIVFSAIEKNGEVMVNMIEGNFEEVNEKSVLEAYDFGKKYLKELIGFQNQIQQEIGKEKYPLLPVEKKPELEQEIRNLLKGRLENAFFQKEKDKKNNGMEELKEEVINFAEENYPEQMDYVQAFLEEEIERAMREKVLKDEVRPDGRKLDELRKISCDVGLLPRTHGSGVFCRGLTKSLSILTLGAPGDVQLLEGMEIVGKKRFMHHYNFPPYSVGEVRPIRGPGRREIGHGMLAEKAILPVIPSSEDFPYTIRVVSEILSSNGSSSMASICSSSLALMDAGVPIKSPVAGIAIGLVVDNERKESKLLTDIQGPEDHYGKMDFKVAGTRSGITAVQLDIKIDGISRAVIQESLERGKKARLYILDKIQEILKEPRPELSPYAPRILTLQIDPEKIGKVIGPGGKMINEIIDECGVSIDIEENGQVFITAEKDETAKRALSWIENLTHEIKAGETFQGKVKRILDFGAFVELIPGQEGLIHISKMASYHVRKVQDVVNIGDIVPVKVIKIDEQGRIDLALINNESHKQPADGRRRRKETNK